jgi:hypothetical protein
MRTFSDGSQYAKLLALRKPGAKGRICCHNENEQNRTPKGIKFVH